MEEARTFARRLREERHARGWSQEDLAEAAGLTRNHVGAVERLESSPTLEAMAQLARGLGTDLVSLLTPES